MRHLPLIDPEKEVASIEAFLKATLQNAGKKYVIVAVSGGIDSVVTLFLLARILPKERIFALSLPYVDNTSRLFQKVTDAAKIPPAQRLIQHIDAAVSTMQEEADIAPADKIRLGNMMARVRMIYLFDLAKKLDALVVGTENKSEYYLGYFTRFGDEASDIEVIRHLYKTQVYQLAEYLGVPKEVITQHPTAGLWENQTDEAELGFSYEEADQVLYRHFEKGMSLSELSAEGFQNAEKILKRVASSEFKHRVPYVYKP